MKKVIYLILSTKVEINTDKNGKSVILYSDNKEEKESKFKKGECVSFRHGIDYYSGAIIKKYDDYFYDIFCPIDENFIYHIEEYKIERAKLKDVEELNRQMLKIGKKWDGEEIVDIIWKPKEGEEYYYINAEGETCGDKYDGNIKWIDEQRFYFGNCFKTGEEAVLYRDKIKELLTNINK